MGSTHGRLGLHRLTDLAISVLCLYSRRRRENGAQVLRCNREELKMLALRERRNRESIAEVIKHQSTPEVDSEASSRERAQEASPRRA